jgi:hypothetical protein
MAQSRSALGTTLWAVRAKCSGRAHGRVDQRSAQKAEHHQRTHGGALLAECGAPGDDLAKIRAAQQELAEVGPEYEESTLRRYRDISHAFPLESRDSSVSHRVHIAYGTPEMLKAALAGWNSEYPGRTLNLHECSRLIAEIRRRAEKREAMPKYRDISHAFPDDDSRDKSCSHRVHIACDPEGGAQRFQDMKSCDRHSPGNAAEGFRSNAIACQALLVCPAARKEGSAR